MKACKDSGGWSNSADHAAAGYMVPVGTICVATGQAGAEIGAEIGADMAPTLNCNHEAPYVAHSLRGEGFDASEDGTGRGTPLVPMFLHTNKGRPDGRRSAHTEMVSVKDIVETLTTDGHAQSAVAVPVAYGIRTANTSSNGWGVQEECTHTLDCAQGVAVAQPVAHAIQAGALRVNPASGPDGVGVQADHAYTLEARAEVQCVQTAMQVRRLTPRECERLQGFQFRVPPDYPGAWEDAPGEWWSPDYTLIPGKASKINPDKLDRDYVKYLARGGRMTFEQCCNAAADGPRYKALGNSWAVPNVRWIGERIDAVQAIKTVGGKAA